VITDGLTQGRVQLSGWFLGEDRDTPYDGGGETPNPLSERTRVRVWLLTADVRLRASSGLQVTTTVPDVTRSAFVGDVRFSETFKGLGDMSAIAWHHRVIGGWNVTFNAGTSLPTGRTERPRFREELEDDSLVPISRLQRGTGTFDPLLGVSVNRNYSAIFPPGTRLFAAAALRLPVAENEHGLRTGAASEISAGASRELFSHNLTVLARLSWLHRARDVFAGTPVLVGGGDWLYLAPGAAFTIGDVTMQAEVRLPLHRSLANRQLDSSHAFQLGVVWAAF
jgi:hypothetical protein